MKIKSTFKTIAIVSTPILCLLIGFSLYANLQIAQCETFVYDTPETIPFQPYGLLLGTAKQIGDGRPNLYFRHRIEAAAKLYHAGKIQKIIVSGDNSRIAYNEPRDMRDALIAAGVRQEDIVADYAGFRTLDSVVRAKTLFGQTNYTVISQKFHCERAIFLARAHGIRAIGFAAREVSATSRLRRHLREPAARVAAWLDILWNRQPKFPR